jgi:CheY-like chemotaxis protein
VSERKPVADAIRTIRLSESQLIAILQRLDELEPAEGAAESRIAKRYRYRVANCVMRMHQPGSAGYVNYSVPTRNIAAGGMGFLHGGFVHKGTRCTAQLMTTRGSLAEIPGTVVRCRYLGHSTLHEVGIEFDSPIDPGDFVSAAVQTRILLAEDNAAMAKLTTAQLQKLNAQVDHVENGRDAVDHGRKMLYDAILMDIEMPEMDGLEAASQLRKCGYGGVIVALTARDRPEDRDRCLEAGCDLYLAKPYTPADLSGVLESIKRETMTSRFEDDESMTELLVAFVEDVTTKVGELRQACEAKDLKQLEALARILKGGGGSYGFDQITQSAALLEKAVTESASAADVERRTGELISWCLRARAPRLAASP